jgi:hypothetical protein
MIVSNWGKSLSPCQTISTKIWSGTVSHVNRVTCEPCHMWTVSHVNRVTCEPCHMGTVSHGNRVTCEPCHMWAMSHVNRVTWEPCHMWATMSHVNHATCEACLIFSFPFVFCVLGLTYLATCVHIYVHCWKTFHPDQWINHTLIQSNPRNTGWRRLSSLGTHIFLLLLRKEWNAFIQVLGRTLNFSATQCQTIAELS